MDEIERYDAIKKENGFQTVWSIPGTDFEACMLAEEIKIGYDPERGSGWGEKQEPVTLTDPTYLEVWKAVDALIVASGDMHHIFIEEFFLLDGIYIVQTGS